MDRTIVPFVPQQEITIICAYPDPLVSHEDHQYFLVGRARILWQNEVGVWTGPVGDDPSGAFDPVSGWQRGNNLGGMRMRLVRE